MAKRRPKIFVGSSSEGSKVAAAFCEKLRTVATVVFWHDSAVFRASESTLNNLIEATRTYDYGFFVFTPDDRFQSRGKEGTMGRDNVLFEFGLFLGSLGQDRAFAVVQEGETDEEKLKVPTDLWGISMPRFKKSTGDELSSEVDSSTWRIRQQIENKGPRPIRLEAALEWNFSTTTQQFSMTLAKEQLLRAKDILRDCRLCIAVRKENNGVNYDEDTNIAVSAPRKLPSPLNDNITLSVNTSGKTSKINESDEVEAFLWLVPPATNIETAKTMEAMRDLGCELLENVGCQAKE